MRRIFQKLDFVGDIINSATVNETEGWVTGVDSGLINAAMADYRAEVEAYMTANHPDATVGDVLGYKRINEQALPIFPGTLPNTHIATSTRMSALADAHRHRLSFTVEPTSSFYYVAPFTVTYALPELAGKKITLSYSPATQADEDVINSFLPAPHADGTPIDPSELPTSLPAYMINLKPELRVDGAVVATGGAITMGSAENVKMAFHDPTRGDDVVANVIEAGEYWGIAVDPGRMSAGAAGKLSARLDATRAKLTSGDYTGLTKDELLGDLLYSTAMMYLAELDVMDHVQARGMGVRSVRIPSETVFKTSLAVQESFGVPTSASATGLAMDADRLLSVDKAMDGDAGLKVRFLQSSGMNSSALEHSVPEQLWSTPGSPAEGVSAVKAIQIAMEQGIPIFTVTRDNIATVMPVLSLDAEVKSAITDAVNAGMEVTVPQTNINFHGTAVVGYIAIDPETGAGAYMISGGDSGAIMIQHSIAGFSTLNAILTLFAPNAEASEQEVDTGKDYFESIIDGARNAITKQCPPGTVRESDQTYYVSCLLYTTTSKYVA
jgi:hypothetical protein